MDSSTKCTREHLTASDPRSVLVTSGTGSGKTECFLVPLLDDLAREAAATKRALSGVRAIMLYPLNALIASQQERLRAWSAPFGGRVRFGLYNGMTPSDLREADRRDMARKHPEQVFDRKTLRSDPPPILVTNVTMLEYLTIRKEDRPLIEKSQGKLRWIIIDEAHSYVGSAAAEIALLLRRVLQTFGVSAADVRFVATSATIGEANEESRITLRRFLAQLAGVDEAQVYVVQGRREDIVLPPASGGPKLASLERSEVAANRYVQELIRAAEKGALSYLQVEQLLKPTGRTATEVLGSLADDRGLDPLLPIRVHHFMRAISGLWSCLNPACSGPKPHDWPFGALGFERTEECPHCRSPMFEVVGCRDCGEPFLQVFDDGTKLLPRATEPDVDEFAAASEAEAELADDVESATSGVASDGDRRVLSVREMPNLVLLHVDLATGLVPDNRDSGQICQVSPLHWEGECPHCSAAGRDDDTGSWECENCGAADSSLTRVEACTVCSASPILIRRFLEPAGFRVDWNQSPHAETDKVVFIEPEAPRISARGAPWEPLLDPSLGRGRSSTDGLVFYSSSGANKRNYRICLDCGRAAENNADGSNPLVGHAPLRGGGKDGPVTCEGNLRSFAVTEPVALGHEILTDVVEFQPASLKSLGSGWALASALREALARRLGIQAGELGMSVDGRTGTLGQITFSVFLFDKNSGGAGFSTTLLDDVPQLLFDSEAILDCQVPGCEHGCSACVLTSDLFAQQETIDRKAALETVRRLLSGMRTPKVDDIAVENAMLSRPIADEFVRRARAGDEVTIFVSEFFDLNALDDQPFLSMLPTLRGRGVKVTMAITNTLLRQLDAAQQLGLRDAALRHNIVLLSSEPNLAPNGAALLASLLHDGRVMAWFTRDCRAKTIDMSWGLGGDAPVVSGVLDQPPEVSVIDMSSLLAKSTTAVREIEGQGRPMWLFGDWFAKEVAQLTSEIGLWMPGKLQSIHYSDRYIRSPLSVGLAIKAMASIAKSLKVDGKFTPLRLTTSPLDDRRQSMPTALHHDWQRADHRKAVVNLLAREAGFDCTFDDTGAGHAREINLRYADGQVARIYLDQGFGYWQLATQERFEFGANPTQQVRNLDRVGTIVRGKGKTYMAALAPG